MWQLKRMVMLLWKWRNLLGSIHILTYTIFASCFVTTISKASLVLVLWIQHSQTDLLAWLNFSVLYLSNYLVDWISKGSWLLDFLSSFSLRLAAWQRIKFSGPTFFLSVPCRHGSSICCQCEFHGKNLRLNNFSYLVYGLLSLCGRSLLSYSFSTILMMKYFMYIEKYRK